MTEDMNPMPQRSDLELEHLTKQIAKGGGVTFLGSIIGRGISVITMVVLARVLGAEMLGLYFLGLAILNLSGLISRLGLSIGSLRFISIYHGEGDKEKIKGIIFQSLSISFTAGVIFALIIFLSADFIAEIIFKNKELASVIKLFSLAIPFSSAFLVAATIPRGFKIMKYYVYTVNFFNPLFNLMLVLFFFAAGLTLNEAIYAKVLSIVLGLFLAIYYIFKAFPKLLTREIRPSFSISTLLSFSIPLLGVNFLYFLIMWTDVLMIGYFLLPSDVGVYRVAAQITLLLTFTLTAFNAIFAPLVADLYHKKQMAMLDQIFKITTKWVFYLTLPAFIIILFSSNEILTLFGGEFAAGVTVLMVLAFAQLVNASTGGVAFTLIMSGRERLEFLNTLLVAVSNIILNILLIPRYGIIGAAIATGFSIIFINFLRLVEVKKMLGIFPYDSRYWKGVISGGLSAGVLFITKPFIGELHYILAILVVTFLTTTITTLTLIALKFDKEDDIILKTLKLKLKKIVR